MERIDSIHAVVALPDPEALGTPGYFDEGNPALSQEATEVSAAWLNNLQEEIMAVIEDAGIVADKTDSTQLLQAIKQVVKQPTVQTISTTGSVNASAKVIFIDCTAGDVTVTLPAASSLRELEFIRKDSTTNVATIQKAGSDTILDVTSVELMGYGNKLKLIPSGTVWF